MMLYAISTLMLASATGTLLTAQWLRACAYAFGEALDNSDRHDADGGSTVVPLCGGSQSIHGRNP